MEDLKVGDRVVYNEQYLSGARNRKRIAAMVGTIVNANISGVPASFVVVAWDGWSQNHGCHSYDLKRKDV